MTQLVLLDNEAIQALRDTAHTKHRRVVSHVQVATSRKRRAAALQIAVPTAVRVEAGWDRRSPAWAFPNSLRIVDAPLDTNHADDAAVIRMRQSVSVADAHVGAVIHSTAATRIAVISSDPDDMPKVAGDKLVTVVTL